MKAPRLRLHHRIVVPFALVALVAISVSAYVALTVTSRALQSRVEAQVVNAATMVSQSDFALNPVILRSVRAIAGAEVITFTSGGAVLASSVDPEQAGPLTSTVVAAAADDTAVHRLDCGAPCLATYRSLSGRPGTTVAVVASTSDLVAATRAVTRTILIAAVLSLVAMVVVSQFVARGVTAPLDELVGFAQDVSAGDSDRRSRAGDDEIGRLGRAFNDMLDRLARSREALVRSEKLALTGLLAARVAHDIRNPLSSIKMQTQLLRSRLGRGTDAHDDEMLSAVLHQVTQVESVIHDLLELARPGELKRMSMRINDVIRDMLGQLKPQLTYRKITVDARLGDALPSIALDADRFKLAMLNVVNNAADAMPDGGTLTIVTRLSESRSTIEVHVCDDGTGIDPAMLARVFDPFVSTKRDGVGLGLVNSKAVIESHGGRIELAPREPKGTRATMWLPADEPAHG